MKDFEVIIVGAGPAGAMMAKELSERKFKVLVLEKELEVGYPNKSTAATPIETLKVFNLPKELGYVDVTGFRIFGPNEKYEMDFDYVAGTVFKFRDLKQYLVKEAIRNGAEVMVGTEVTSHIKEDGKVTGVKYKGYMGKGSIKANVIVDASGPSGLISSKLGLWKKDKEQLGVAFEYFLKNAKPDKAKKGYNLDLYFGSENAPGGYAWIFPTSKTEAKAGICKLVPTFKVKNELSQKEYFKKLWEENEQIKGSVPFEAHDCAHYITGGVKHSVLDNFIAIGDAVNKVNPLFGEGVRSAFYSARFASDAIERARKGGDYSKRVLSFYDKLWKKKWGMNWFFAKIVFRLLYNSNDKELDELIKAFKNFNPDTMLKIYIGRAKRSDYLDFLKVLPGISNKQLISAIAKNLL